METKKRTNPTFVGLRAYPNRVSVYETREFTLDADQRHTLVSENGGYLELAAECLDVFSQRR
jgi:hypothetical protein